MNRIALLLAGGLLALAGCTKELEAPTDAGVCYHMVQLKDGTVRFNKVAQNVTSVEKCAVALDAMRLRFLAIGGSHQEIMGAYQGQFLFLGPTGVFIAQHVNGARYPLLVPNGEGQLVKPGSAPAQPGQ
jgi:hypothetical protein